MVNTRGSGFTLIELMVVVAVLALLVAVAYPSYQGHICKVERNQAKADLLAFAQNMESMYSTNNFSYLHDSAQAGNIFPPYSPSNRTPGQKRFDLSVTVSEPGDAFILTAERVGGSCNDGRLTLANNGQRQWVKAGVTLDYWED